MANTMIPETFRFAEYLHQISEKYSVIMKPGCMDVEHSRQKGQRTRRRVSVNRIAAADMGGWRRGAAVTDQRRYGDHALVTS
jgi:hypothetical protein